jgi:pimeloyl-ACP methyl ester carboxylesterase
VAHALALANIAIAVTIIGGTLPPLLVKVGALRRAAALTNFIAARIGVGHDGGHIV